MGQKNWFTVKQVAPRIWGIGEFSHPEKVITYLIVGIKKALLWDTGLGLQNIKNEVEKITNLPLLVINSHSHYDHVGGNKFFKEFIESKQKVIRITPYEFCVINTPGHSPDSICLYENNLGYLFSGDTLYNGPIYIHLPESNVESYRKSIHSLLLLPCISKIFPSHNSFTFSKTYLKKIHNTLQKIRGNKKIIITNKLSLLL